MSSETSASSNPRFRIEWCGGADGKLDGANVTIAPGVVLELATLNEDEPQGWGVWGIRIDGTLYREPRDLEAEPLAEGPFRALIEQAEATARNAEGY